MTCPACGARDQWRVLEKRNRECGVYRRRECTQCLTRYASMERLEKYIKPRHLRTQDKKNEKK